MNKILSSILFERGESQVTENTIRFLETSSYVPDEYDLINSSLFLKSDILMSRAINKNPYFILKLTNPSDTLIQLALSKGFIPEKKHFIHHPYLKKSVILLEKAFENDPSIIVFFEKKQINCNVIKSARDRGFIASENELLENRDLCNFQYIMEDAIRNNPRLIVLIGENCNIDYNLLKETLKKYKITKEDLEHNVALTKYYSLMKMLPEFYLYSAYLDDNKKMEAIASRLTVSNVLTTADLPFLDYRFGGKVNINDINELLTNLNLSIDEDDIDIQAKYLQVLDKIVDGIVNLKYIQNKTNFKYPDIVSLNNALMLLFNDMELTKNPDLFSNFIYELYLFSGKTVSIEEIAKEINNFFKIYVSKKTIDLSVTNEFCNKILNQHRNCFMSNEKIRLLALVVENMSLSDKKKVAILNGLKLEKIAEYIKYKNYQLLGITEEQIDVELANAKNSILNNKKIKKLGIQIDSLMLDYLASEFKKSGIIDEQFVRKTLNITNVDVSRFVVKKFEQIKFRFIDRINLSEEECVLVLRNRKKAGLNQTNYIIGDNRRCVNNLAELIIKLDEKTIKKILDNKKIIGEVAFLLPFINLIEELNIYTFMNILTYYDKIRKEMLKNDVISEAKDINLIILKRITELITLANAYGSVDAIILYALGKNIVSEIGEHNSLKYLDFYIKMLYRKQGGIPPVNLKTPNYYFESGVYTDPERLLIGKKPDRDSCIDLLNTSGVCTYNELLLQNSGDVILVRDSQMNLISRILIFRRGNVVQMVTRKGEYYNAEIYEAIANQIIQCSIAHNDNIDYVFVNSSSINLEASKLLLVEDNRFFNNFMHADFLNSAVLLSSKKKVLGFEETALELDFEVAPLTLYTKNRKNISFHPTENEITRLRALKMLMENNFLMNEELSSAFKSFSFNEYNMAVCGEDWYIALDNYGTIEELRLPIDNLEMQKEIEIAKNILGINSENQTIDLKPPEGFCRTLKKNID